MTLASLVFENARRDFASADARIALVVQCVLAFFLLSLTLTSASIQSYLDRNLEQMLGADLVIETFTPLTSGQFSEISENSNRIARTATLPVVLTHGSAWERAQLKILDEGYPVQGEVRVAHVLGGSSEAARSPGEGAIWLGPRLAAALGAAVGENIEFGGLRLRVEAIVEHEPDRLMEGHSVAMRAVVHEASLESGSIDTGNARHRYLITASPDQEAALKDWLQDKLPTARVLSKRGGDHPLALFWKRVENLFGLLSVALVVLGAVALDMTNRRWLEAMQYRLALYQSFGVTLGRGLAMLVAQWAMGFVIACAIATALAVLAQLAIIAALSGNFPGIAPSWSLNALAQTLALLAALALVLQLPFLVPLARASAASLIRHEGRMTSARWRLLAGSAAVSIIALAYTDNWHLSAMVLGALAAAIIGLVALTWLTLWLGDRLLTHRAGLLPFVVFLMRRRIGAKTAQVVGLGASAMLLLVTLMLLGQIGEQLENQRRTHNGNLVIAEASERQAQALTEWSQRTKSEIRSLRPFVSAQLVQVNGRRLTEHTQGPSETLSAVADPIRLHWTDALPANNRIVRGAWWDEPSGPWDRISVEEEVMIDLGIDLGDELAFDLDGETRRFTVSSAHVFQPGAGSVTFWFQVPAAARVRLPGETAFMGFMELPEEAWDQLPQLWSQHPGLSLVPLSEMTERFDRTVDLVRTVSYGLAIFILSLTVLVMAASVRGFEADDRLRDGLLLTMGFERRDLTKLGLLEWSLTGALTACGAIGGTWIAGMLIFESQFGMPFHLDATWVAGTIAAIASVLIAFTFAASRIRGDASIMALVRLG